MAPRTGIERLRRLALGAGTALLLLAAALLLVRAFVADVYRVDSGSMAPALLGPGDGGGGDAVLVRHAKGARLERFEPVVLLDEDGDGRVVKRVVGLPGERVQVPRGDLLVDGEHLGADAPRPAPIPVFDQSLHDVAEHFYLEAAVGGPWSPEEGGRVWRLDARDVPEGAARGLMMFRDDLLDSWVAPDGEVVHGRVQVNDGLVECELLLEQPVGRIRLWLVEEGDTFEVTLTPTEPGRAQAALTRRNPVTAGRVAPALPYDLLEARALDLAPGVWHHLRFANVDNHLALDVDGRPVLYHRYRENVPYQGVGAPEGRSVGARAALGGGGVVARFRGIRILRDLYWVPVEGLYGVDEPVPLGPDEYFVLGDNSADSTDSRHYGPVPASRVLGRPLLVVWPPDRARPLEGPGPLFEGPDPAGTPPPEPGS